MPLVALVVLAVGPAVGCRGSERSAARDWEKGWADLADARVAYGPGSEWELRQTEATPSGPQVTTIVWRLLEIDADQRHGQFEIRQGDRVRVESHRSFHSGFSEGSRTYFRGGPLAPLRTPAGRFSCGRTNRSWQRREGEVMDVDEWWAPNVPVPIQSWERPAAESLGALYEPPEDAASIPVGCRLQRLARLRLEPRP